MILFDSNSQRLMNYFSKSKPKMKKAISPPPFLFYSTLHLLVDRIRNMPGNKKLYFHLYSQANMWVEYMGTLCVCNLLQVHQFHMNFSSGKWSKLEQLRKKFKIFCIVTIFFFFYTHKISIILIFYISKTTPQNKNSRNLHPSK